MAMREVLDDCIGPVPASRIDIDELLRRGHRIRRRRQGVVAGVAGLAVLGVVAAAVVILPGGSGRPSPATTPTASPSVQAAEPDRLLAALKAAIAREAPQVSGLDGLQRYVEQCTDGGLLGSTEFVPAGQGVKASPCPSQPVEVHYRWQGKLTAPTGKYVLRIDIIPTAYYDPGAAPVNSTDADERRIAEDHGDAPKRGPHGESILVERYALNLAKPDGTGVLIQVWDTKHTGAYLTRSPFTAAQLTAIGLDPALHL
jgi:hypothetical protein